MLNYRSIEAVAAVVLEGSFERAAATLKMTPSAVSQRVRALEERLGAIVIHRGQPCEATELGRRLCEHFDRVRLLEQDLGPVLGRAARQVGAVPTLAVSVNADSLATWFLPVVAQWGRDADGSLDLKLSNEGHTADMLRSGKVLAAVTADPTPVQGCNTVKLGNMRYVACASSAFVEQYFRNTLNAENLSRAPHLRYDRTDTLQIRWAREFYDTELMGRVYWVPSTHDSIAFILSGLCWGMQPMAVAERHLGSGRLVELPPKQAIDISLYWTVARLHSDSLRHLTNAVQVVAMDKLSKV